MAKKKEELNEEEIKEVKETKKKEATIELKENWEELLADSITRAGVSHWEVNAIKPLINGLIK